MLDLIVNGRFLSRRSTGVDRFAREVLSATDALMISGDHTVTDMQLRVFVPPGVSADMGLQRIKVVETGRRQGQAWEQVDLPRAIPKKSLLLNLCNTAPLWLGRQVVVVHDAATVRIPAAFSWPFRMWYRMLMPILGRVARRVLSVSEFARGDIVDAFGIPYEKTRVVVEGGEHILGVPPASDAMSRFGLGAKPYVLAVSSMAAHKNFALLLEALHRLPDAPFEVVIAGGAIQKVFGDAGRLDQTGVHWVGYVTDAELRALYEHAMCFVFPSLYEGFGIPPLEAMTCGCPVLAARAASIPEVCGEAAIYFDPYDADSLVAALVKVADDPGLRRELTLAGRQHVKQFSWDTAARQVLAACREAVLDTRLDQP